MSFVDFRYLTNASRITSCFLSGMFLSRPTRVLSDRCVSVWLLVLVISRLWKQTDNFSLAVLKWVQLSSTWVSVSVSWHPNLHRGSNCSSRGSSSAPWFLNLARFALRLLCLVLILIRAEWIFLSSWVSHYFGFRLLYSRIAWFVDLLWISVSIETFLTSHSSDISSLAVRRFLMIGPSALAASLASLSAISLP